MKKLLYSLILIQIFLLTGGCLRLSANHHQGFTRIFEETLNLHLPACRELTKTHHAASFFQAPVPNTTDHILFDFIFSGYEEESEELNGYKRLLSGANFPVILSWVKAAEPYFAIEINSPNHSTASKNDLTESPRFIVFQVFRI